MITSALSTVKIVVVAVIIAGIGFAGWYITGLRADLATAKSNVEKLETAIDEQQKAISSMKKDFEMNARAISRISSITSAQSRDLEALRNRFNVSSATNKPRDVGSIARRRPESVERIVNAGSAEAARCLELASGAEHTPQELEATLPSEINSICPELANPRIAK